MMAVSNVFYILAANNKCDVRLDVKKNKQNCDRLLRVSSRSLWSFPEGEELVKHF